MTLHYLHAPRIEVADDRLTATGVCYLLGILDRRPASSTPGSAERERVLLGGVYALRFLRVDGRWLFSALACDITMEMRLSS